MTWKRNIECGHERFGEGTDHRRRAAFFRAYEDGRESRPCCQGMCAPDVSCSPERAASRPPSTGGLFSCLAGRAIVSRAHRCSRLSPGHHGSAIRAPPGRAGLFRAPADRHSRSPARSHAPLQFKEVSKSSIDNQCKFFLNRCGRARRPRLFFRSPPFFCSVSGRRERARLA